MRLTDYPTFQRIVGLLQNEDGLETYAALSKLRPQAPKEIVETLLALLRYPDEKVRRRAGGALSSFRMEGVDMQPYAESLADYLEHGPDPRVRLSCAILMMSTTGPVVNRAYLHALRDSESQVAQLACLEVGARGSAEGRMALFQMLDHPHWRVRLEACKALITQENADQRVISTLEAMSREPEAAAYDAECEDNVELLQSMMKAFGHGDKMDQCWGKLATIIQRARDVATPG